MMIGSVAMAQASGITCPHSVSRSCCSGELKQSAVVSGFSLSRPSRVNSGLRLARPAYSAGAIVNVQPGLSSSFCVPQGGPHIKAGRQGLNFFGNAWERRICNGRVRCQLGGASSPQEDAIEPDASASSAPGGNDTVQFDLNLPRRSALLEFTCNVCKARTERMINPDAFRRGTVYVQCGGCEAYHQLVDNLNLVKEYDFKNEVDPMRNDLDI